jgi:hypothetical protein
MFKKVPMPEVRYKDYECDIMVLGLRNLVSTGILPVRKAYVQFNLKSILTPEQGNAVENIRTHPKQSGSNPNIITVLQFKVNIPEEALFCPSMTCTVFD